MGGVHVRLFGLRAISPRRARPPRAAPPPPYPTTPRRASPPYPARPTSWRWCQHGQASVVRAAQPAAQADAAVRPEGCGHCVARSRQERDTGVSWRRSLVALRWVARRRRGRSTRMAFWASRDLAPAAPAPRGAPNPHTPLPRAALPRHYPRAATRLALVSPASTVGGAGRPTRHSSRRRCAAQTRRPFCAMISTRTWFRCMMAAQLSGTPLDGDFVLLDKIPCLPVIECAHPYGTAPFSSA